MLRDEQIDGEDKKDIETHGNEDFCSGTRPFGAFFSRVAHIPSPYRVEETAAIGEHCVFDGPVTVSRRAVLRDHVRLGAECVVSEVALVGPHVILGPECTVAPFASLARSVSLGKRCVVEVRADLRGPLQGGPGNVFRA